MGGACSTYAKMKGANRILMVKPRERYHFKDSGIDKKIILRLIFRKWDAGA